MIRDFLKLLIPVMLGVAVLMFARRLDAGLNTSDVQSNPEQIQVQMQPEELVTVPVMPVETEPEATEPVETEPEETESGARKYTLTFLGDCTLGSHTVHRYAGYGFAKTVGDDFMYPFRNVLSYLENDHLTLANLEGSFSDKDQHTTDNYCFWGPESYVNILVQNSVEVVSLANNHSRDFGVEGYVATKQVLDNSGVTYVEPNDYTVLTLDGGLTVGIYGTSYNTIDQDAALAGIRAMKSEGLDVIVYAPHWGAEHLYKPTDEQIELAHAAIDAGADIVWGTHPYVLQPVEEYNGGVIYYSLGNFCFGGDIYLQDYDTAMFQQEILVDESGEVTLGELKIVPCSSSSIADRNNYQPTPYSKSSEGFERVMAKLNGEWKEYGINLD